jgi:hypothetical protein
MIGCGACDPDLCVAIGLYWKVAVLELILRQVTKRLHGATATDAGIRLLRSTLDLSLVPDWLVIILRENGLAGVCFSLDAGDDLSGLGAELLWLTPAQVVSEATECEPGLSVVPLGYIPVGACATGSGDPYFLDMRTASQDPPLVRIPHDYAGTKPYPLDRVELVTNTLSGFFSKASF